MKDFDFSAAMIDAALPWLRGWQHMRTTDKRGAVEQALIAALASQTALPVEPAPSPDAYARFLAWAKPFVWSGDKAAMDLAWLTWRAALASEGSWITST